MVEIGAFECSTLVAQPFGYEESETRAGRTARKWTITGLVDPAAWLNLLSEYDTWRDLRIEDEDTLISGVVGTTVLFSGTGPGGQAWTNVPCWFVSAPSGEPAGIKILLKFEVVDAAQALEVLLKEQQTETTEDLPSLGTYTIEGTVLTLLKPIDAYRTTPAAQLAATGTHYVTGPLIAERLKDIEGTTDAAGWANIRSWYEEFIEDPVTTGVLFPVTAPSATAAVKIVSGLKTTEYTVALQLLEIV
jgi:hypothetical protein